MSTAQSLDHPVPGALRLPRPAKVLLVSPHPDDIAWSLGGTVARVAAAGAAMSALTVFGRTSYAPGSAAHGTSAAIAVRAREDVMWATATGVRLHRGDLPDASLRGYDDDTEMGAQPEPAIVSEVADRLTPVLRAARPDLLLVPLAVRGHVDHLAARSAAEYVAAAEAPDCALLYYEDLPYAAGVDHSHTEHPVLVDVAGYHAQREAGVLCYPSQEPHLILPIIAAHTSVTGGERLWGATASAAQRLAELLAAAPQSDQQPDQRPAERGSGHRPRRAPVVVHASAPADQTADSPLRRMESQPW
ncbi:PIG-L deacetylase family protein [Micromonospora olivasterospora]|uniref:LmbE family N-acetylglucosaminyl deacetylase n=1 Tax=Micromonospora olivasterospora TaxID=1880 RepID=Q2MG03_MICOL|nr:PIG-L family deacetylase [Micromonospora olivasterospora]TWH67114.1 LmbE family N-acetylglucosaminyl deacetylase [Micromonospora olivasterospora]CAF31544.1 putative N-acetylhexosaminyl deacetylase [Micromonospora olivasterospora]